MVGAAKLPKEPDAEASLKATLETIAVGRPTARIDKLMPWGFGKPT